MNLKYLNVFIFYVFFLVTTTNILAQTTYGTIVVGARNDKEIILGTDSKQNSFDYTSTSKTCKIKIVGNKAIALAGLRSSFVPGKKVVDFLDIADEPCLVATLKECADKFTGEMIEILKHVAPKMKEVAPVEFGKHTDDKGFISVLFCGFESGIPTIIKRDFNVQDSAAGISLEVNQQIFNSGTTVRAIGETTGATRYGKAHPKLLSMPLIFIVRNLIQAEIVKSPGFVGEPISIVRLSPKGITWIQPGECQCQNNAQRKPSEPTKKRLRGKTRGK